MTLKILLVENDEPTCKMLQKELAQHGYNVVSAMDGGDKGILMAVTEAPDLIMIATDLPVIDGWQTIKILKNSTVTQNIPIMALMALTSDAEWGKATESGCDDYELKPIDLTSVLNKIKTLLSPAGVSTLSTELSGSTSQSVENYSPIAYPARESQVYNRLAQVTDQTAPGKSMVVYIDDSPADSRVLAEIIRGAGYHYGNISEPLEAIPTLLELKPNLIFLDLVMPLTNGYELCAQIRRTSLFRKTPIIIVTNNDGILDRVRAKIVGASGFFAKPVQEKRILKALNKHLGASNSHASEGDFSSRFLPFI